MSTFILPVQTIYDTRWTGNTILKERLLNYEKVDEILVHLPLIKDKELMFGERTPIVFAVYRPTGEFLFRDDTAWEYKFVGITVR